MKISLNKILSGCLLILLIINMFLYTKTTVLSDQMLKLEKDTKQLRIENISLEKQLANNYSLENLTKLAKKYGFSKISNPVYLKQLHYAFILDHD